ncbi:MAG: hypothetical protein HC898_10260 [Phycisphaerales bacterium]|nr:hypothetical protein [Phycisphaerales bacterium]
MKLSLPPMFAQIFNFRGNRPGASRCSLPDNSPHKRVQWIGRICLSLITLGFLALVGRVVSLQMTTPEPVAQLIDTQHSSQTLYARRGAILDRRGRLMSSSDTIRRLFADPLAVRDTGSFAERVHDKLGYDPAWLEKTINSRPGSRFIVLDQTLSDDRFSQLARHPIHGLGIETRQVRRYPMGTLAGQVIGFVGYDGKGMEGLEKLFQHHLAGTSGKLVYLRDSARKPIWVQGPEYVPPQDGLSVRISSMPTSSTLPRLTCRPPASNSPHRLGSWW